MGCALCKQVATISSTTNQIKETLDVTQATLNEAEAKIRTLETSLHSLTEQVSDVRSDLSKLLAVMEQVPQIASTVATMQQAASAGIIPTGSMTNIGSSIGGLFTPWSVPKVEINVPEPPSITIEAAPAKRPVGKANPPPPHPEPEPPAEEAPAEEEKGEVEAPAPKKKIIKKVVKKVAPPPSEDA